MTIKEVEEKTGLARSNIRFYEKESLICPARNGNNSYREYSWKDVEEIEKIAFLRTLGVSIEEIRLLQKEQADLGGVIQKRREALRGQLTDLENAGRLCGIILADIGTDPDMNYESLDVKRYIAETQRYWKENERVFRLDCAGFLFLWGSGTVWVILATLCLAVAVLSYGKLPLEIPIQWSGGEGSSYVDKQFIFAYPAACFVLRLLSPYIQAGLGIRSGENSGVNQALAFYIANSLCFLAFSVEVFTILFIYGIWKRIELLLLVDAVILIGLLAAGIVRLASRE